MSITCHPYIWIITVGFEECNEWIILVNYGHNQMVRFREKCGQSLVRVGQTWSNLIDGPETTRLSENHIQTLIIGIEKYGDILVLMKFENNWMVRLIEHSCHAPNLILGFVTTTGMLILSLNLILTRTNLTFWKLLQKLSS